MASKHGGYMGEALWVDLSTGQTRPYEISDRDRELFVGNKGLGAKILWDNLEPGIDPLGEENLLAVTTSPVTGTGAPCSSRFNVSTKGPLTGGILASNTGGDFGIMLKRAGYDALIIAGKAKSPVYLEIDEDKVQINDASDLWGKDTEETQALLLERHGKRTGQMVIGPAGENLVRYACILSGERALGRGGIGTVMGSKLLKAVVANGTKKPPIPNQEDYKKAVQSWIKLLKEHPVTGDALPTYGTAGHLNKASALGVLPTRNFSAGTFENAFDISGEELADKYLTRNGGCQSCPIRCERRIKIGEKEVKGPEYETIGMFGSNIGNKDLWAICEWNYLMDKLGMDTITAGGAIAFATELTERGLLKSDLAWGKIDGIEKLLNQIAYREGLGDDLAEGVMRMAEKYGGGEYAIHGKGLEMAAYEPRRSVGMGLGYATANRGACHLNSGFLIYFENLGPISIDPQSLMGKPGLAIFQQNALEAISVCGSCIFTSYAVIPGFAEKVSPTGSLAKVLDKVLRLSGPMMGGMFKLPAGAMPIHLPVIPHSKVMEKATGFPCKAGTFLKIGNRVFNLERMFNVREGLLDDTLPERLTQEEQLPGRPDTKVPLDKLLPPFYKSRGWDSSGMPTPKTLRFLNLDFAIDALPEGGDGAARREEFIQRRQAHDQHHVKLAAEYKKIKGAKSKK